MYKTMEQAQSHFYLHALWPADESQHGLMVVLCIYV